MVRAALTRHLRNRAMVLVRMDNTCNSNIINIHIWNALAMSILHSWYNNKMNNPVSNQFSVFMHRLLCDVINYTMLNDSTEGKSIMLGK